MKNQHSHIMNILLLESSPLLGMDTAVKSEQAQNYTKLRKLLETEPETNKELVHDQFESFQHDTDMLLPLNSFESFQVNPEEEAVTMLKQNWCDPGYCYSDGKTLFSLVVDVENVRASSLLKSLFKSHAVSQDLIYDNLYRLGITRQFLIGRFLADRLTEAERIQKLCQTLIEEARLGSSLVSKLKELNWDQDTLNQYLEAVCSKDADLLGVLQTCRNLMKVGANLSSFTINGHHPLVTITEKMIDAPLSGKRDYYYGLHRKVSLKEDIEVQEFYVMLKV